MRQIDWSPILGSFVCATLCGVATWNMIGRGMVWSAIGIALAGTATLCAGLAVLWTEITEYRSKR